MSVDDALTEKIIGCASKVANTLGPVPKGLRERVAHELRKAGISVVQQAIQVHYDGSCGRFRRGPGGGRCRDP